MSDDCGLTGTTDVWFIATDECGNADSVMASFIIEDTTNPSIDDGFGLYSRVRRHGQHDGVERLARQQRWRHGDACSGVTWSNDYDALSDDCGATDTVTFTATDDCGNATASRHHVHD